MMEDGILRPTEDAFMEQEEKCRKALKTLGKALFMRMAVTVLLFYVLICSRDTLWIMGMMVFVMVINIAGSLPLAAEWKKQRRLLRLVLDQYE